MAPRRSLIPAAIFLFLLLSAASVSAQQSVSLAWDASTGTPAATGYVLQWGTRPGLYTASIDVGNRTDWTVSGLNPDQRYYFTVLAYSGTGASRVYSNPATEVSNNAVLTFGSGTLRDDRPGIFWHNQSTGQLLTWHLNGTRVVDTRAVSVDRVSDTNWKVAATGDLNGDGYTDMVWRHQTEGWLAVWYLQNNLVTYTGYLSINRMTDPGWRITGIGDVNGDRYGDIVWQHSDGRMAVWTMNGATVQTTQFLSIPVQTNPRWLIRAIFDVNNDGYSDLVWHSTDGYLAVWHLRGTQVILTQYLSIPRMTDTNWQIQAVGKPDGTGAAAIVWRHIDGRIALWYLNGPQVTGTLRPTPDRVDDVNWKIVGSR